MRTNLTAFLTRSMLLLTMGCTTLAGQIIYVNTTATGNNDGSSWTDAYNYLQDALAAALSGDEIWVAKGIYNPDLGKDIELGDRNATFKLKNGVAIYGGFQSGASRREHRNPSVYKTILSGDLYGDDIKVAAPADLLDEPTRTENSYNVVTGSGTDATAVLDGFIITAGNAGKSEGGGMFNDSGSPTLTNCIFIENSAKCGGGMYNQKSNPMLVNCSFIANAVRCCGAGMRNLDSNPALTNCLFKRNFTQKDGGGMRNSFSNPTLTDCTFIENSATGVGGGIFNYCSNPTLNNCKLMGNSAASFGGGIHNCTSDPTLINCTFSRNLTQKHGGGLFNCACGNNPILINCTFSGNSAKYHGGGMYSRENSNPTLTNCILWGNSDRDGMNESAQISVTKASVNYCCIQALTGGLGGISNINADPLFARSASDGGDGWGDDLNTPNFDEGANDDFGDLRLLHGSPCIDAGDNTVVPASVVTDIDGNVRFIDGDGNGTATVDIGASEHSR